jgi:hypothetical protein
MNRLIDRILDRVAPKVTASACSSVNLCNAAGHPGLWNRFCCPQTGCTWGLISTSC